VAACHRGHLGGGARRGPGAIEDIQEELEGFDRLFVRASDGPDSAEGSWTSGPAPDGRGDFTSAKPSAYGERPVLPPGDPRLYGTPSQPIDGDGMVAKIKDALT
jgi:Mn-containing catalase